MIMHEAPKDRHILRNTAIVVPPFAARNAQGPVSSCFPGLSDRDGEAKNDP